MHPDLEARARTILQGETIRAVEWRDGHVHLLDQRLLPKESLYIAYDSAAGLAQAIKEMVVRGAPAIGIAGAYGVVLAVRSAFTQYRDDWRSACAEDVERVRSARPTAVNLHWGVQRILDALNEISGEQNPVHVALNRALSLHEEDIQACRQIGAYGAELIPDAAQLMTHCNAGALATGGYGTALGVIRSAHRSGKVREVYVDETRPWLQGARLTAWELVQENIPATLLADCAAAFRMRSTKIDWVVVGADRIAANGDVANKIGTYGLALSARAHGVKFMVAAPCSTFDLTIADGDAIPIEERSSTEVTEVAGHAVAASGIQAWNPVFDVTPAHLIDAIVTERGAVLQPNAVKIQSLLNNQR